MKMPKMIPSYALFGEIGPFPDAVHVERIFDRARIHDWKIAPHRHERLAQIFLITQGHVECRVESKSLRFSDDVMFYLPPDTVHGFEFSLGTEGSVVTLHEAILNALTALQPRIGSPLARPWFGASGRADKSMVAELQTAYGDTGMFRKERLVLLVQAVLASIAERNADTTRYVPSEPRMRALDRLLDQNHAQGWSPADYANAMSVTTGHLNRIVRRATGRTLSAYVEKFTMAEACRLLAFTRLTVAEIGHRVGYSDPAYFSRRFSRCLALTPSAYRAQFTT